MANEADDTTLKDQLLSCRVEGSTRVIGIIGDPIDHSLSPRMHNAAFAALGLDYVYVPFRPDAHNLREAVASLHGLGVVGFNVTVPYKKDIMRFIDRTSTAAIAIGAVNTVYSDGRNILGENTDAGGFHQALLAHSVRPRGKRVLVIGAGGSARAVVYSLLEAGASDIVVANRTPARVKRMVRTLDRRDGRLRPADLEVLDDIDFLSDRQLVINCTPLGLKGSAFLDYAVEATPSDCLHFDLAYGQQLTPFLELARESGRPIVDGRHMLVYQGALAFKLFTGRRAPIETMLEAVGLG